MEDKRALKYVNQLTKADLKYLLLQFVQTRYGAVELDDYFRCEYFTHFICLESVYNVSPVQEIQYLLPIKLMLDDYYVYEVHDGNFELSQGFKGEYHKYMRSKFGQQYTLDWIKNY